MLAVDCTIGFSYSTQSHHIAFHGRYESALLVLVIGSTHDIVTDAMESDAVRICTIGFGYSQHLIIQQLGKFSF